MANINFSVVVTSETVLYFNLSFFVLKILNKIIKESGKLFFIGQSGSANCSIVEIRSSESDVSRRILQHKQITKISVAESYAAVLKSNGEVSFLNESPLASSKKRVVVEGEISDIFCFNRFFVVLEKNGDLVSHPIEEDEEGKCTELLLREAEIKQIICGENELFLLDSKGDLLVFDYDFFGFPEEIRKRILSKGEEIKKFCLLASQLFILKRNGQVYSYEHFSSLEERELVMEDVSNLFVGKHHSFLLKRSGSIFGMGSNIFGQLGLESTEMEYRKPTLISLNKTVKEIFCGANHTVFIDREGRLFGFGSSKEGQIPKRKQKMEDENQKEQKGMKQSRVMLLTKKFRLVEKEYINFEPAKIDLGELVSFICRPWDRPLKWSFQNHLDFDYEFQTWLFTLMICISEKIPLQFKLPKPLLKIIVNFCLL